METVKSILGFISGGSSRKKAAAASTGSAGGGSSSRSKRGVSNESVEEEDILCMNEVQHLTAHKDIVRSLVCVDVLGKKLQYLISSSDDTTICIWDAHTGRLIHTLRGHTMPVKCVLVIDNRPPTDKQPTSVPASAESDACAGGGEGEKEDDDGLASVARSLILISGSSDRSIRVWDIITGKCLQVLDKQNGSVFSLSAIPTATSHQHQQQQHVNHTTGGTPPLDSNGHKGPDSLDAPTVQLAPRVYKNVKRFCSGASDNDIQIWSITPDRGVVHSGKISSYDSGKENLSWILVVNSAYVVAGSSSTCGIAVYSLDDCMFLKLLTYHRELPQATACISSRQFVSGSLDGSIIVWNSNSHLAEHTLYNPREYQKDGKKYLYNVSYLLPLHDRYVVAAIGKGFSVFDLYAKDDSSCVVLQCPNAHDAAVTCALSICNGAYLLTSSEDSVIKMWKMPPHLCLGGIKPVSSSFSMSNINTEDRRGSGAPVAPTLVTELYGHVNVVPEIVKIDEYSFASCSSDTEVIIWKDGYRQSELRNMYAVYSLTQDK